MNFITQVLRRVAQSSPRLIAKVPQKNGHLEPLCDITSRLGGLTIQERCVSLYRMHRTGPHIKERKPRRPLDGKPFMKGVVLKTLIKKPKKPNSANRKCVLVRLSNGKEMVAYIPGIGHNLQEHNIVLCRVGRVQDCPGVKIKCVRGKYDLGHVIKK
ncbi:small ribosomal subunit protein uS12m [Tribolium castaneum]|uniref:Small ribosomal subunit protein uS12m n=1 Tax=Tribolium castaneum TaxID=7070 RepID=D1ZZ96_TRICA|nr:PREDICTED: 40S ribosomal protein S12, mitochondrial [Tribolium castaneum]EFA01882.1 40S ribosomal protein S12, mitochondrial-like Protein [Tribolium castaneum]|eukprot:XP_968744.1 PREDICTED: 40S ribosomal protein S12, mitochondrial [Tribolium castaneum]